MFKFFKDKIKQGIKAFSKKVEEEIEEEQDFIEEEEKKEELKESVETKTEIKEYNEEKSKGFFSKVKDSFKKTKISEDRFEDLFFDLELILLENNVALEVVEKIKNDLKEKLVDTPIERKKINAIIEQTLKETIDKILTFEKIDLFELIEKQDKPFKIAFFGVNGSGKTTTIAKLAYLLKQKGFSCVIAASDTFRAAAIDQLEEHAKKLGVKVIKHQYGSDPTAVAFDAVNYAKSKNIDVVLIDTAGRLHSNTNLMDELKKLKRVIQPDLNIFVGESITGNDCIEQVKKFDEAITIDGIILTKSDVDEKGGTAISVAYVTKKPILFLGTGQSYNDLKEFNKEEIITSIFA
ncbi:MAG: fused signal recognition particle receptor [Candidatus Woesearchaeota archaeon]|nr:fused signal recognition particle receptor [Candidatus Woesearchaeota archaeon]